MKWILGAMLLTSTTLGFSAEKCLDGGSYSKCIPEELATMQPGKYLTFRSPDHQPTGCSIGTNVIVETATLSGPIVTLSEFVEGYCAIAVDPDQRTYQVSGQTTPCGSIRWTGSLERLGMVSNIEIMDHRGRMCDDEIPSLLVIDEQFPHYPQRSKILYTQDYGPIPNDEANEPNSND